jgi:hypothetical protein
MKKPVYIIMREIEDQNRGDFRDIHSVWQTLSGAQQAMLAAWRTEYSYLMLARLEHNIPDLPTSSISRDVWEASCSLDEVRWIYFRIYRENIKSKEEPK